MSSEFHNRKNGKLFIFKEKTRQTGGLTEIHPLTKHFTYLEPQNKLIAELYMVQKR